MYRFRKGGGVDIFVNLNFFKLLKISFGFIGKFK